MKNWIKNIMTVSAAMLLTAVAAQASLKRVDFIVTIDEGDPLAGEMFHGSAVYDDSTSPE